jgi:glyoxylase-like metal-dependent hydrolase (beta-lactamase superfamily II)
MLASGVSSIDLNFIGRPHVIATAVIQDAGAVALVDPGPSTCLEMLGRGLEGRGVRLADVTHILLTHIHLDHAGATGTIVRQHPHIKVFVQERGAPHVIDPSKLIASASRLYGDQMERLWGEILPVPASNLTVLAGGERVDAGGRTFETAYTPGHASHHISYFNRDSGIAFVGDTAGVCIDGGYVLPPTPPPDIDPEAWQGSVAAIEGWGPRTLFLTHFGAIHTPVPHLRTLLDNLDTMSALVRKRMAESGTNEEKAQRFGEDLVQEWRRQMPEPQVAAYIAAAPPGLAWAGLERYWRKKVGS